MPQFLSKLKNLKDRLSSLSIKQILAIIFFFSLVVSLPLVSWAVLNQRMQVGKKAAETTSSELLQNYPLNITQPIYKLDISGTVVLSKPNSLARVVLIDNQQNEYLVYEAYPLITDQSSFAFTNVCEETCLLNGVIPSNLRIEGENASLFISQVSTSGSLSQAGVQSTTDIAAERQRLYSEKVKQKVNLLNAGISKQSLKWTASETSVSRLTYAEKKKLFSNPDGTPVKRLPNLQGFEYYYGGVFEIKSENPQVQAVSPVPSLPTSWDWRNVHGENWLTPVKNQLNCGSCWAFADAGSVEAGINLYHNQHLNIDLSEQDALCRFGNCNGAAPGTLLGMIKTGGILEENCLPYTANPSSCTTQCSDLWKISSYGSSSVTNAKKTLIEKGPLSSGIYTSDKTTPLPWTHGMVLVGYDSQSNWIFKNSWGVNWGDCSGRPGCIGAERGYATIKVPYGDLLPPIYPIDPFFPPSGRSYPIDCVDKDADHYCNWGLSVNKPASCPSCFSKKDCDDSNSAIGPAALNAYCPATAMISPLPSQKPSPSPSIKPTPSPTQKPTSTPSPTPTKKPTATPTKIFSPTPTATLNPTQTTTLTPMLTPTQTLTPTLTATLTPTPSALPPTPTLSPTPVTTTTVVPTLTACSCPAEKPAKFEGNANCDDSIDGLDFEAWREEFQGIVFTKSADFNCDGAVNGVDFEIWREKFTGI